MEKMGVFFDGHSFIWLIFLPCDRLFFGGRGEGGGLRGLVIGG